ncbi:MAG: UDP-N-acetylmuramoyl-tripeptide--D-alanyl-D-alanine ligase [Desulfitobacteriaceae bacterium]
MWYSETIAQIVQGTLLGEKKVQVTGCVLDSRAATGGEIFFALPGQKVDGQKYISSAWEMGVSVAVAAKARNGQTTGVEIPPEKALILVDSVTEALQKLALVWRQEMGAKVIGITGSSGKTTTKDMVAAVLSQRYRVHKSRENHNNELGLPLTILNAPRDTEILVLEMGMRGLGEIRALCRIALPDTGVITNIGVAHMELLGTQENIAKAKWELIEALPLEGMAFLNTEDHWSVAQSKADPHPVRFYGLEGAWAAPEVRGSDLRPEGALETVFTATWGQESAQIRLPLPGEHNVLDALAALAVGTLYGVSLAEGGLGLAGLELSKMRLEILPGILASTLISDVYNANPASTRASLRILKERAGKHPTVAILGDMYELGEASVEEHRSVGRTVADFGLNSLITVGDLAQDIAQGARGAGYPEEQIVVCPTQQQAVREAIGVLHTLTTGSWVLIKGSRGMKMEGLTAALQAEERAGF